MITKPSRTPVRYTRKEPLADQLGVSETELAAAMAQIPEEDAEILRLYFVEGLTGKNVGKRCGGISQAGASYRINHAIERLRWLLSVPVMSEEDVDAALELGVDRRSRPHPREVRIAVVYELWRTSSQSVVAAASGIPQGTIRCILDHELRCLARAARKDERIAQLVQWFRSILRARMWNVRRLASTPQRMKRDQQSG